MQIKIEKVSDYLKTASFLSQTQTLPLKLGEMCGTLWTTSLEGRHLRTGQTPRGWEQVPVALMERWIPWLEETKRRRAKNLFLDSDASSHPAFVGGWTASDHTCTHREPDNFIYLVQHQRAMKTRSSALAFHGKLFHHPAPLSHNLKPLQNKRDNRFQHSTPPMYHSSLQCHLQGFPLTSVASFLALHRKQEISLLAFPVYLLSTFLVNRAARIRWWWRHLRKTIKWKTAEGNKQNVLRSFLAGQILVLSRENVC